MASRSRVRTIGSIFYALTLGATVSTTIGLCLAYSQKAPTWAFFLLFGSLLAYIPLGGVVGHTFRATRSDELGNT